MESGTLVGGVVSADFCGEAREDDPSATSMLDRVDADDDESLESERFMVPHALESVIW